MKVQIHLQDRTLDIEQLALESRSPSSTPTGPSSLSMREDSRSYVIWPEAGNLWRRPAPSAAGQPSPAPSLSMLSSSLAPPPAASPCSASAWSRLQSQGADGGAQRAGVPYFTASKPESCNTF